MSTEHQRYSPENQSDAIAHYAQQRGIEIVRTYSDEGKSGLMIQGRDSLKQLIEGRATVSVLCESDRIANGSGNCEIGRVSAGEIEAAVIDQLRAVLRQPEIVAGTRKAARAHNASVAVADTRAALQQLDPLWD